MSASAVTQKARLLFRHHLAVRWLAAVFVLPHRKGEFVIEPLHTPLLLPQGLRKSHRRVELLVTVVARLRRWL